MSPLGAAKRDDPLNKVNRNNKAGKIRKSYSSSSVEEAASKVARLSADFNNTASSPALFTPIIPTQDFCQVESAGAGKVSGKTDFMFDDPLLKLMSVSLVTSEGSMPLIPPHHHHHQNLQHFYHQQILHQQNQQAAAAAAAAAMLVHNGRLPGGSPVPVPSPNSSLSHPESPRSQAADSSSSPPMTIMAIEESSNVAKMIHKSNSQKVRELVRDDVDIQEEVIMAVDEEENDEVLSIGGKDDEQMMMDCDGENVGGVIRSEKEEGGSPTDHHQDNKINGSRSNDGDDDEEIDKRNRSPKQDRPVRCPSASTTTAPSIDDEDEDNDEPLDEDVDNRNPSEPDTTSTGSHGKRLKSHKNTQDNPISQKSHNHHNAFNIVNLSRHSPTEDLYNRHHHHFLHHQISPTSLPHPSNYFLQQSHFFHQHLINNHDTSSNHSTASSTNNSTSPSPSFNNNFLHHHQQQQQRHQQQQTAAVAAAHSLIFSIANILRPDFGLCNNNNNNNDNGSSSSGKISGKSGSSHGISLRDFGAKRHSSGGASTGCNGKTHANPKRSSGHRESSSSSSSAALHHRTTPTTTTPIDLSRPSSTGSATMQMISPNSIMSMMLDRGGVGSGTAMQNNTRQHQNQHHPPHHQKGSKSEKHPHAGAKAEKPGRVVTPSVSSANPETRRATNGSNNNNKITTTTTTNTNNKSANKPAVGDAPSSNETLWPAWVYCTRYSDRPSSGPRTRRTRKAKEKEVDEKRPRTAFTAEQLSRLKKEFDENRYLTEKRRQDLARELKLHENQIKIWFQNKRAKLKKATGSRGGLAQQLMAQGLYNHSTIPPRGPNDDSDDDEYDDEC